MNIQLCFPDSKAPKRATEGSAGYDVFADESITLYPGTKYKMPLGFMMEGPERHGALLLPRSGKGSAGLHLANVIGLIDWDYRGVAIANLKNNSSEELVIHRGDAIAQMLIVPVWVGALNIVASLSETVRGTGGFGSTGQ